MLRSALVRLPKHPVHNPSYSLASPRSSLTFSRHISKKYRSAVHFRNGQIPHEIVHVLNPITNSESPPSHLATLLKEVNLNRDVVVLVSSEPKPLVKVISKDDFQENKQVTGKLRKKTKPSQELKTIQMTWGIAQGDLEHKLEKARVELEKGNIVRILLARGKGAPPPSPNERKDRVEGLEESLKDTAKLQNNTFQSGITTVEFRPKKT